VPIESFHSPLRNLRMTLDDTALVDDLVPSLVVDELRREQSVQDAPTSHLAIVVGRKGARPIVEQRR